MAYQIQSTHSDLYRRLLILDPPPKAQRVAFSDLNEVRRFYYKDPPEMMSGRSEVELLRAHVRRLERKINRLERNNMITPLNHTPPLRETPPTTPRTPSSSRSVYSPVSQPSNSLQTLSTLPPPSNVQRALNVQAPSRMAEPPVRRVSLPPVVDRPKPSMFKRIISGCGALCILGVLPGLLSMVALGPVGLAVAGGCIVLGCLLLAIASHMN